jgi:hypothetical protein
MLKFLMAVGWGLVVAEAAVAQAQLNPVDLVCYMQTADGRTIDLGQLCGQPLPVQASPLTAPTPVKAGLTPYTNLGNLDIYSRGRNAPPCFGLDDQGNPCSASR